jgi:hypothetical protein
LLADKQIASELHGVILALNGLSRRPFAERRRDMRPRSKLVRSTNIHSSVVRGESFVIPKFY